MQFETKPQLAAGLLKALFATKLYAGRWITCDCSFGNSEEFLQSLPEGSVYLAELACTQKVWVQRAPQDQTSEFPGYRQGNTDEFNSLEIVGLVTRLVG